MERYYVAASNTCYSYMVSICGTAEEAQAYCGGAGGGDVCPGTCSSSTCGDNGSGNCSDFNSNIDTCKSTPGCLEDNGSCIGHYCKNANGSVTDCPNIARDTCSSLGCNWAPNANSCADTCTGGTCHNACGDTTSCTVCAPTTCAAQGVSCGSIPDGCGGTPLNCGDATCTISASPTSMTLMVGEGALLSSNVTITSTCGSTSSVSWGSSNPSVATVGTPGSQTTVTGVSTGVTNISATASLSPSGSCSTTTPTAVTVLTTFFQTFGGDVTFKGTLSNSYLPSGKYISGR